MPEIRSGQPIFGGLEWGVYDTLRDAQPGLIVDAGAAAGNYTRLALNRCAGSHALAFEPFPGNWPFIEKTLAPLNARLVKAALSDRPGEMEFAVPSVAKAEGMWSEYSGYSSAGFIVNDGNRARAKNVIQVPVTTIDEHVREPVRFFKIDVQGGEMGVLGGASDAFARGIEILFIEFDGEREILTFLNERDYVVFDHRYLLVEHKKQPDMSDWAIEKSLTLSSGHPAHYAWPKALSHDFEGFCALFSEQAQKIGAVYTDIVAVRRDVAQARGWL